MLQKQAVSKLHLLLRRLNPPARLALLWKLGLPELAPRITSSQRGGRSVRAVLSRPSTAIPQSLAEGLLELPGYERLAPALAPTFLSHLEKHYPGLNVTKELGAGLESGALAVAPSAFTRRVTRETGPVVLKYGVTYPWHRAALKMLKEKQMPPTWRLRSFVTPGPLRWSKNPQKVYTWFEPLLQPTKGPVPEGLMMNRIKRMGLEAFDIERGDFSPPQLGYRLGRQGKLMPLDRGIVSENLSPVYAGLQISLSGGDKYATGGTKGGRL
jgi:hypothetical protein